MYSLEDQEQSEMSDSIRRLTGVRRCGPSHSSSSEVAIYRGEMSDFSYAPGWGLTGVFLIPHAPGGEMSDFLNALGWVG